MHFNRIQHLFQANSTFAPIVKLVNIVHSFADSFSSVDKLREHLEGLSALQNLIATPQYSAIKKTLLGDVEVPSFDVNGLFEEFGDPEVNLHVVCQKLKVPSSQKLLSRVK